MKPTKKKHLIPAKVHHLLAKHKKHHAPQHLRNIMRNPSFYIYHHSTHP